LAGTQNNTRARTELLVLLTPHVIRDQNGLRAATADMRDALRNAAAIPTISANEPVSGSDDPNGHIREKIRHDLQNWFKK
jgi:general secretion pathway protein D